MPRLCRTTARVRGVAPRANRGGVALQASRGFVRFAYSPCGKPPKRSPRGELHSRRVAGSCAPLTPLAGSRESAVRGDCTPGKSRIGAAAERRACAGRQLASAGVAPRANSARCCADLGRYSLKWKGVPMWGAFFFFRKSGDGELPSPWCLSGQVRLSFFMLIRLGEYENG